MKPMYRIITYLLISGLVAVGMYAGFTAFTKVEVKPERPYRFVTRQGVDSSQMAEYRRYSDRPPPVKEPIKWNEITTMIVSVTVALGTIGFKSSQKKISVRFDNIESTLQLVVDQKNRDNVDQRLVKIEQDASAFVDDENVKALIEGMGSRSRSFCRDVMEMDFTEECLDKAILKMNARAQDSKHHVRDLGFSDYFIGRINEIRCAQLKQLKLDLTRLVEDHLHNSKYERFGEIICRFQRNYMKEVIKLHNEKR